MFGSRSTYALCVIGGLEGRAIREGDTLPVGNTRPAARAAPSRNGSPTLQKSSGCTSTSTSATTPHRRRDLGASDNITT